MSRHDARLDREIAVMLAARAFTEIRYLAGDARRSAEGTCVEEDLERIRFLADLCHNLPVIARPRPSRRGTSGSSREQTMVVDVAQQRAGQHPVRVTSKISAVWIW